MKIIDDGKVLHIIEEDSDNEVPNDEVILRDHREGDPDPLEEIRKKLEAECADDKDKTEQTK